MMLQALYQLSQRENLVDLDYEKKGIDFLIRIDTEGNFLSLEPTADEKGRAKSFLVPRIPERSSNVKAGFLLDNTKYVLGIDKEGKSSKRIKECRIAFYELVTKLYKKTNDPGALAICRFSEKLDTYFESIFSSRPKEEWKGKEYLSFIWNANELLYDRPKIRSFWNEYQKITRQKESQGLGRCLVTGDILPIAEKHQGLDRIPPFQSLPPKLVSFNEEAFTSQLLKKGENAQVSQIGVYNYSAALNWLLQGTKERIFRYGIPLGNESVTVFWTKKENDTVDMLASFFDPKAETAVTFVQSVYKGLKPTEEDLTPFYALTLSRNASRVVVRDWFTSTMKEVKQNIQRYFDDLSLGKPTDAPLALWMILKSLKVPGKNGQELSPTLSTRLFRAALRGTPFPRELLYAALRRIKLPPKKDGPRTLHARCALIKAILLRLANKKFSSKEVTVSLDEKNEQVSYLLGRLFSILERLQEKALGKDLNTTIRDRYFGAASSTPALVFPRLIRLSMHHAAKGNGQPWLEKLKGNVIGALPAESFPQTLSLEEQGLFAIGYYHQREKFFEKKKEETITPENNS